MKKETIHEDLVYSKIVESEESKNIVRGSLPQDFEEFSSRITMASDPAGTLPPVGTFTQVPCVTLLSPLNPVSWVPVRLSSTFELPDAIAISAAITAYPSTFDLLNGGIEICDLTVVAETIPAASEMGTSSLSLIA